MRLWYANSGMPGAADFALVQTHRRTRPRVFARRRHAGDPEGMIQMQIVYLSHKIQINVFLMYT